jgi:hypothetical protein
MNTRIVRALASALVLACAVTPAGANVTPARGSSTLSRPPVPHAAPRNGSNARRKLRVAVSSPTGCTTDGGSSFVGGGSSNYAGGGAGGASDAGVLEGAFNEACDEYTSISGGADNVLGGDDSTVASSIAGGAFNTMELAQDSFVGAGQSNALGYDGTGGGYGGASESAIVSGTQNVVESPLSFIGAGSNNLIDAFLFDAQGDGQNAFIGAGSGNTVKGYTSGIVAGAGNSAAADYSIIAGGQNNSIQNGSTQGATGSSDSFIGGGASNSINASLEPTNVGYNVITGGLSNLIAGAADNNSAFNVIGGGNLNVAGSNANGGARLAGYTVIGGGYENGVNGNFITIAGGSQNSATATSASVGGGTGNSASGIGASIGGGTSNSVAGGNSTVAGGYLNSVAGANSAVGGGYKNAAGGAYATVPGGAANTATGTNSFAAGTLSNAAHNGAFVWSDNSTSPKTLASSAQNQFLARAAGGFFLYSSAKLTTGVKLAPGSGSWASVSDRNVKTGIVGIDDDRILAKVAALPISEWSYTAQGTGIRHLGPMAQDFRAAFGLGEDDRHISTIDEDGVALAAIKALQSEVSAKNRSLAEVRERERADHAQLALLERRLARLEAATRK